jgi:hypothetical protein
MPKMLIYHKKIQLLAIAAVIAMFTKEKIRKCKKYLPNNLVTRM